MIRGRDATSDDLDALIALGSRMRAESIEPFPPVEPARVRKQLDIAVAMPGVFLVALAEDDDGSPVGMVTAVAGDWAFSSQLRSVSDLLFVLPERRGLVAAKRLVQRFLDWSDDLGAKTAIIGVSTGVSPERTGRFLELMGFQPMGTTYRKDRG